MGHIAHLRKQFKSINKYDYIIMLIQRIKKKTLWEFIGSSFEQTWIPFTQGWFVLSLVHIGSVVLEKKIFLNFFNEFSLFRNYLPLKKGRALHLTQGCLVSSVVEIGSVVLEKKIFKFFIYKFSPFKNYSPWEMYGSLVSNKLHSL